MEPWLIEGIISGVVANGLTTIVLSMGGKSQEALQNLFRKDSELDKTLKKVTQSVTNAAELDDEQKAEKLRMFLSSPNVESIVRQIYANKLTEDEDVNYLKSIHEEILVGLSLYLGEPEKNVEDLADQIFDVLLESCDYALTAAIEEGNLFAHEAKSSLRHSIIIGELAVIKKNLDFLTVNHKINIQEIIGFEKKYLAQVEKRHWYISPPYFNEARKLPINDIFVNPTFISLHKKEEEYPNKLDLQDFLSNVYRSVVLGNPGGGKSTLSLKLCHDLAEHYSKRILAGRQVLPILVVLRDYGAEKKDCKCSILQFIETMVNSEYQIEPPNGAFEYLLLNGRAVVIFDGLDELIETRSRQQISDDIESFCNLYPSVPVLVTSREVGYGQAPLDEKTFELFQLAPFNDEQVEEYVTNWFYADTDLTKKQNKQKIDRFIKESNSVSDLRSNPLMLALMCNIYRGENYIPKNRADVYEKCSLMLFEQWDKRRGIRVELQIEAHIKPAMMYLAHWIYSDNRLQGGVTERKLIKKTAEYLLKRRFEDLDEAEKAAQEFIEFCRGRAWVFTDTGTTKEGERLYQFTHRTFIEYFTATHIVRTHATPNSLSGLLLPKIANSEWDVVSQLAFQLQNRNIEGAGDELLTELVNQANKNDSEERWNFLTFAASSLGFMVMSPKVIRNITKAFVENSIIKGLKQTEQDKNYETDIIGTTLNKFLSALPENRTTIADSLKSLLVEKIKTGRESESTLAFEFSSGLTLHNYGIGDEVVKFWNEIYNDIFEDCFSQLQLLCPKNFKVCYEAFNLEKISLTDFIHWHGLKSLFYLQRYKMHERIVKLPLSEKYIFLFLNPQINNYEIYFHQLKEICPILLNYPLPWITIEKDDFDFFIRTVTAEEILRHNDKKFEFPQKLIRQDILFGAFSFFSVCLEFDMTRQQLIDAIKKRSFPFFNVMHWIFIARYEKVEENKIQDEMDRCGFTPKQQDFIWRWIQKDIDLIKNKGHNELQYPE